MKRIRRQCEMDLPPLDLPDPASRWTRFLLQEQTQPSDAAGALHHDAVIVVDPCPYRKPNLAGK